MSDEYLWDRSGTPAPDELWLERVMPSLRHERSTAPSRRSRLPWAKTRSSRRTELGVLLAVAALAAAAFGIRALSRPRNVTTLAAPEPTLEPTLGGEPAAAIPLSSAATPLPGGKPTRWRSTTPAPPPGSAALASPPTGTDLDATSIQRVVKAHTNEVRRACWQRALVERDGGPTTARVTLRLTIAASGAVSSSSTSGDPPGFPGLGACVANQGKSWRFPASNGSTTIQVPFVFATQ